MSWKEFRWFVRIGTRGGFREERISVAFLRTSLERDIILRRLRAMSEVRQEDGGGMMELWNEEEDSILAQEEEEEEESLPETPLGSSRAGRLWQKVKDRWELVEFHALPDYLRDNEFILRHYRPNWPMRQILLSTFTLHNETINIWT